MALWSREKVLFLWLIPIKKTLHLQQLKGMQFLNKLCERGTICVHKMVRGWTSGGASPYKHLLSTPVGLCHAICYLFEKLYRVFISIEFQKWCASCVIQDYINCLLSSVTGTDAKDGHGLKIEKVEWTPWSFNSLPAITQKIMVISPWWKRFNISFITLQAHGVLHC